jgi:hypothetical protein
MIVIAILLFLEFYFQVPSAVITVTDAIKSYAIVIAAFAMGLGVFNLSIIHIEKIQKREEGQWYFSIWMLLIMALFIVVGLVFGIEHPNHAWIYNNIYIPVNLTVYSLIGWLVYYSIYRSFRVRSIETLYLLVVFFFTAMGNAPIGEALWTGFPAIRVWIETIPNASASRGFAMANALGAISIGLRTIVGKSRAGMD